MASNESMRVEQCDRDLYRTLLGLAEENLARRRRGEPIVDGLTLIARHRTLSQADGRRDGWQPIETAPRDREIDLWVAVGVRIADCHWGRPTQANWGDRYGADKDLPPQWVTRSCTALDRRNGSATHWRERPAAPSLTEVHQEKSDG